MQSLYLFSVFLHLLLVALWLGGMLFLVLVVLPWLRRQTPQSSAQVMSEVGLKFSKIVWVGFGLFLVTGLLNAWFRGVELGNIWASPTGRLIAIKLGIFGVILAVSAWHDFKIGPEATTLLMISPQAPKAQRLRALAAQVGRVNFLLGLVMVALGIMIVRGVPW